ncbi:AAA family ATPase [Mycetocola spongiae]|uniref:AAA family ATPase n=1 Tax=Mycetocola spongiae TaxID=2859226 RepID=UPI001CF26570|nr:AAA family ATPase [Mycetocola spongiae]UCR89280.1 AAA family ATPase [Mycetocola spongiae]
MEITNLKVTNFKGLRHADIDVAGKHLIVIGGKNGAGKSSFLDAFAEIIDPKGTKLTRRPIHDGQDRAEVTLTTDCRIIKRVWTGDNAGTLAVAALDGAKYGSPSDAVKKLVGAVPFDPLEFTRRPESEQRQALLARVDLPFDLATLEAEHDLAYKQRTDANREAERTQAHAAALPDGDATATWADHVELLAELEAARAAQHAHDADLAAVVTQEARQKAILAEIAALNSEYTELEAAIQATETRLAVWTAPDIDAISARLAGAEATNTSIREAQAKAAALAEAAAASEKVARIQAELDRIAKVKADGLAGAAFPAGLSVDDDGITVDGVPFKQINSAKKVRVAFELVTLAQPDLRIVMIKDGSLLDSESLMEIEAVAIARGYLVLIEVVTEDDSAEFTVTEGVLA